MDPDHPQRCPIPCSLGTHWVPSLGHNRILELEVRDQVKLPSEARGQLRSDDSMEVRQAFPRYRERAGGKTIVRAGVQRQEVFAEHKDL